MSDQRVTALLRALSLWTEPFRTQIAVLVGGGAQQEQIHRDSVEADDPADEETP